MLWGALLEAFGEALGDTEAPTTQRVVDAVQRCAEVVQQRGKASVGDKTMLDALVPFATALQNEVAAGSSLASAWAAAAAIAKDAAQRTADLLPKTGRARPLGERSIGTPDPGAVSMALCLAAASDLLERDYS
jgi:dihydroxyacetone kinase